MVDAGRETTKYTKYTKYTKTRADFFMAWLSHQRAVRERCQVMRRRRGADFNAEGAEVSAEERRVRGEIRSDSRRMLQVDGWVSDFIFCISDLPSYSFLI